MRRARRARAAEERAVRVQVERIVRQINSANLEQLPKIRAEIETSGIYPPTVAALLEVVDARAREILAVLN